MVEVDLVHYAEKKALAPWRRQLDKGGKNKIYGIYDRAACCAERLRLTQHLANCLYNLRDGVFAVSLRRSAAWLGLVSTLGQRSVIFIHAFEVDHGLTAHLVGPDPLVGDQLVSLVFPNLP